MEEMFLNRCRACSEYSDRNTQTSLLENNNLEMFSICTNLKVTPTDCLPTHVCMECFELLTSFITFREKCVVSELRFKEELETRFPTSLAPIAVKIEPLEDVIFKHEHVEPINESDDQGECILYETEYIDEAFSQYDPDRNDSKPFSETISDTSISKQYVCDYCDDRFDKKSQISSHILKHKNEAMPQQPIDYPCTVEDCRKHFTMRKSLTRHLAQVHKMKAEPRNKTKAIGEKKLKLTCTQCPKWFTIQHKLDAHIRRVHEGLKPYKCTVAGCGKEFCKSRTYEHHMKFRHSDIKIEKFACTYSGCDREYELQDSLKVHINRIHLGILASPKNQKLICDQCGRSFKNSFNLKEHSYSHSGLMPFCCKICPKKFISNYKLKIHTMRHLNIKNFVCPTCGLRKTTNKELQAHLNFHSKEIIYPCKECTRVFASYSAINRHVRIHHRNHKPYLCKFCQRAFAKAETCRNHEMTHTGEKPFSCAECGHRFIQSVALKAHMKVHAKK